MRNVLLAAAVAALLVPAAPAFAGDPIMPLSDVHAGMRCTGYSVVRGTEISSFDVDVIDVADGNAVSVGPRILVQVSGPAVDATGLGPGFSGSPIYCPDAAGVSRNIGAISESIGEYGGKVALATPIEQILATPVDPPATPATAKAAHAASGRWARLLARAKPLAEPLSISGLSGDLGRALSAAAAKSGRPVLAAPAGPLGAFPPQTLRPGSAVGVGYSSGDIQVGGIGTVSYVDGDKVWAFGHPLEGVGGRALLLQDAYVFHVVNNPLGLAPLTTYKLASLGHVVGTIGEDQTNAVAGRTGVLPHTVPIHVLARDADTGATKTVDVSAADEAAVDLPSGSSWTSQVAPLAVIQAMGAVLNSSPARLTGDMCVRISLAETAKPLRFCNRYVSTSQAPLDDTMLGNAVVTSAALDVVNALGDVDAYTGKPPEVTGVSVLIELRRGAQQAFMRGVSGPRVVRPGQRIKVRVRLQRVRGDRFARTYRLRIPAGVRRGPLALRLVGRDVDQFDDAITTIILGDDGRDNAGGDPGPGSLKALAREVRGVGRYDGVTLGSGRRRTHAFRDAALRISGHATLTVRVHPKR